MKQFQVKSLLSILTIFWMTLCFAKDSADQIKEIPKQKTESEFIKSDQMIKLEISKGNLKDYYPDSQMLLDSLYWNSSFAPHSMIINMQEHYVNYINSRIEAGRDDALEAAKKRCKNNNHKHYGVSNFSAETINVGRGILVRWSCDIVCAD